jgi:hypothetical protein
MQYKLRFIACPLSGSCLSDSCSSLTLAPFSLVQSSDAPRKTKQHSTKTHVEPFGRQALMRDQDAISHPLTVSTLHDAAPHCTVCPLARDCNQDSNGASLNEEPPRTTAAVYERCILNLKRSIVNEGCSRTAELPAQAHDVL